MGSGEDEDWIWEKIAGLQLPNIPEQGCLTLGQFSLSMPQPSWRSRVRAASRLSSVLATSTGARGGTGAGLMRAQPHPQGHAGVQEQGCCAELSAHQQGDICGAALARCKRGSTSQTSLRALFNLAVNTRLILTRIRGAGGEDSEAVIGPWRNPMQP